MILFTGLVTHLTDILTTLPDMDMVTGTITTTDTTGIMHVPLTPGDPVDIQMLILLEVDVLPKVIIIQTARGVKATAEYLPKVIRRVPVDTM
jgi:hypothetical protein